MVTLVAVDKVYADFIVHSFITTELCFCQHYLFVPHLEKCFVVFLFDLPCKIYYSSLWNSRQNEIFNHIAFLQKPFIVKAYQKLWFISIFDINAFAENTFKATNVKNYWTWTFCLCILILKRCPNYRF